MRKITRNVFVLGWVSFLTDVSSEMILPILPLFLANVLKAGMASIGLIEGVAESTASLLKVASGWYSDRTKRRKPLVVSGYLLSNLVKPCLALVTSWGQVLGIRFADRVGKGIRTSPRDALIAESSEQKTRGRSFGFHRMMDTAGAVVGTSIAYLVLSRMAGAYRTVFALSAIPGVLAILVVTLFVRERTKEALRAEGGASRPYKLTPDFRLFLFIITLFTFANVSYAFYVLRASELGIAARMIPIIYLMYNMVYTLVAMPVGILSDRFGRVNLLLFGFGLMALLLFSFGQAKAAYQAWLLFIFYGGVIAIMETVPRALISDIVPSEVRGTALGLYHTCVGVAALPAGLLFGFLWQRFSSQTAFIFGAAVAAVSGLLLFALWRKNFAKIP